MVLAKREEGRRWKRRRDAADGGEGGGEAVEGREMAEAHGWLECMVGSGSDDDGVDMETMMMGVRWREADGTGIEWR